MRALALAVTLAAAPVLAEEAAPAPATVPAAPAGTPAAHYRLYAGAKLGLVHPFGVNAVASLMDGGKQAWDVDLLWEPSGYLQSYSVGAAWHPLAGALYVGPRVRWLQFGAPWERGFSATDNHLGLSAEVGGRWMLGPQDKGLLSVSGGATWVPTESGTLQWLLGLNVGFAWGLLER